MGKKTQQQTTCVYTIMIIASLRSTRYNFMKEMYLVANAVPA